MVESKIRILVVEDDENIRETVKSILEQKGYEADAVETGAEAEQMTKNGFYNLALLDIKLPDIDGTQLLAKLNETAPKTVKIMVTGYPSLENSMEALNQGAAAYVIKPVKPVKLLALVEEKLEKQRQEETMTENKVTDWIKIRAQKIQSED